MAGAWRRRVRPFDSGGQGVTSIRARPTLYKGIQMRSRLEADYAAHLDQTGAHWHYESECFAGPDGQWLPDFSIRTACGNPACKELLITYIEVKPDRALAHTARKYCQLMPVVWLSQPEAYVQLVFWTYGGPQAASVAGSRLGWHLNLPGIGKSNGRISAADVTATLAEYEELLARVRGKDGG